MIKTVILVLIFLSFSFAHTLPKDIEHGTSIIIGKYDRVDLPQLKLENIKAKIDSGAKTSSLHCSYIKLLDEDTVIFEVLDDSHKKYRKKRYSLPIQRVAYVKSSNGITEQRFVVLIKTVIFGKTYEVEYTLRDREKMNFPILLGREFLKQGFIIDVNKKYLSYSKKPVK